MQLWFASGNTHKKMEMERLFPGFEIILPKERGIAFDPDETSDSYIGNALIKAEALYSLMKAPVLADDSGLEVEALGNGPGIHTARYGGEGLSARDRYMLLLRNMEGIQDRRASFVSALVLILSPRRRYIVQEECKGRIALAPSGASGFGYDPVFFIDEAGMISAELPEGDKDLYSHRGKAARKLRLLVENDND